MKRILVALAIAAAACGPSAEQKAAPSLETTPQEKKSPPPPSTADARKVIESSADFGEFLFTRAAITLPLAKKSLKGPALDNAKQLAAAGWIDMSGAELAPAGKVQSDPRFLVRPNGFMDVVPVVKKEMGEVASVTPTAEGVDADFTWRWQPTEVGRAFTKGPVFDTFGKDQHATATLLWDGKEWGVLRIREKEEQPKEMKPAQ